MLALKAKNFRHRLSISMPDQQSLRQIVAESPLCGIDPGEFPELPLLDSKSWQKLMKTI